MLIPSMVKIVAHGTAFARPARTGENVPIIITIPKDIVRAMKIKKGENLRLYTDGENTELKTGISYARINVNGTDVRINYNLKIRNKTTHTSDQSAVKD